MLSLIWGYNWVMMKACLAHASPLDVAGWRFLSASLSLLPVLKWMGYPVGVPRREWALTLLLSLLLAVNFTCTFTALTLAGTGKTAVLTYTMPFWVVVLAHFFLRERMKPFQWLAAALAGSGLVVLVDPSHLTSIVASALAVGAGLSWAVSIVVIKRVQGRTQSHMLTLTVWQMLIGSAVMFVIAGLVGTRSTEWTPAFIGTLAFTSVVASTFAWILFYYALARLPAGITGLGMLAAPAIGVLSAWLQFGETPTASEGIGMILIGAGLALLMVPSAIRRNM
ncbi:MAG: DMT family transporter [Burkholderiales bacterium]